MQFSADMKELLHLFEEHGVQYTLVGGHAVNYYGYVRTTQDMDLLGEYPALRYYPPSGDLYFDIMTRLGEAAVFEGVEAMVMEVEGIRVSVATPRALYALKRDTVRPLDHQDAEAPRQRFDLKED